MPERGVRFCGLGLEAFWEKRRGRSPPKLAIRYPRPLSIMIGPSTSNNHDIRRNLSQLLLLPQDLLQQALVIKLRQCHGLGLDLGYQTVPELGSHTLVLQHIPCRRERSHVGKYKPMHAKATPL